MDELERKRKTSSPEDFGADPLQVNERSLKKRKASIENGEIIKERSEERYRDRDRKERERSRERSRDKQRDRDKERRSGSYSDRSRDRHERDYRRDRERGRDSRERDSKSQRDRRDRDRDSNRSSHSSRNKEHDKERSEESRRSKDDPNRHSDTLGGQEISAKTPTDEEYQRRLAEQLNAPPELSDEQLREIRRQRRQEILRKHQSQQSQAPPPLTQHQENKDDLPTQVEGINGKGETGKEAEDEFEPKQMSEEEVQRLMTEERARESQWEQLQATNGAKESVEDETKSKSPLDLFAPEFDETIKDQPEVFDMFDMSTDAPVPVHSAPGTKMMEVAANLSEVTDDAEGYYQFRPGEVLNDRFQLMKSHGKGVFSSVVKAKDLQTEEVVAVKVLRNNEAMKRMGLKEIQILKDLALADPPGKYNCVRLLDHFEDREHLCLVFEFMGGGNLRDVLKKYGTKIGLSIKAVKIYAVKLFLALRLLKKCKILHADIKLDNVLVNENKTSIKLADFGSASNISENTITPYLVSRFYRAPEIVMGLIYSYPIDMWSVGCSLFEIATGKILFPGKSNNEMLWLFMEVCGPMPKKMQRKGEFSQMHFDEKGNFKRVMLDKTTGREYIKLCAVTQRTRNLKSELLDSPFELTREEQHLITQLEDLLSKIFVLDPNQRITVEEALRHPFISS